MTLLMARSSSKSSSKKNSQSQDVQSNVSDEQLSAVLASNKELIKSMQSVVESPAMNGGFNKLMFKIEKIEEAQTKMTEKIDLIHDAIYHPDEGIFARIKDVEHNKSANVENVEKNVIELITWKGNEEKASIQKDADFKTNSDVTNTLKAQVVSLASWQKKVNSGVKWLMYTAAGGILTLLGKLFYEFITGHMKFV